MDAMWIIAARDEGGPEWALALGASPADFLSELLAGGSLLANLSPDSLVPVEELEGDPALAATFDATRGSVDVVLRRGVVLDAHERRALAAVVAGVWAPASARVVAEPRDAGAQIVVYEGGDMFAQTTQVVVHDLGGALAGGPRMREQWRKDHRSDWADTGSGAVIDITTSRILVWPESALDGGEHRVATAWKSEVVPCADFCAAVDALHGTKTPISARIVAEMLAAFEAGVGDLELFHGRLLRRLHDAGFGERPPGLGCASLETPSWELRWSVVQSLLRAARHVDPSPVAAFEASP